MKVILMGSGDFAVPILERLAGSDRVRLMAAATAPDRPAGRGREISPTPVKRAAQARGLHVFEPADVNRFEFIRELNALSPDVIVVADFGQKLGRDLLGLPRYYCINAHPSLLPRYRGATPILGALADGATHTGVTVIRVTDRIDAGPILGSVRQEIPPGISAGELEARLAAAAGELVLSVLDRIREGTAVEVPQDDRMATVARKISKEEAKLDWTQPAERIAARVQAMNPVPGTFTLVRGERIKILKVRSVVLREPPNFPPGTVVAVDRRAIWISCVDGVVGIQELQPAGKAPMATGDYLNGHPVRKGDSFGS